MIRTLIVEDELLAAQRLADFAGREALMEIIGTATCGVEAARQINRLNPDLVFMDIHLGDISGLDVLRLIERSPAVIFTTAYDQYAVKAFELNAVDYLLKPFEYERFHQAVARVAALLTAGHQQGSATAPFEQIRHPWHTGAHYLIRIPSKRGDKIHLLADDDIIYCGSENKLVFAFMRDARHLLNYTLDELQERLDPAKFFRIHRSSIVNLNYVNTIESSFGGGYRLTVKDKGGTQLAVSRPAGKLLRQALGW